MPHSEKTSNVEKVERRKHWRDRRKVSERRNQERLSHMESDCRNNVPRRESDVSGTLVEGELWWSGNQHVL